MIIADSKDKKAALTFRMFDLEQQNIKLIKKGKTSSGNVNAEIKVPGGIGLWSDKTETTGAVIQKGGETHFL